MHASDWSRFHPSFPIACAGALVLSLTGCGAMGQLAHDGPWAWLAVIVVVLAVVGFIVSRMRR